MERKIVKIRVDMYSDTKFKIIDTMEDRDLIHYIWTRLLTLAGKVNLDGELYLSKNIAYTIETLALEFNRSAKKVALALKVFMDLEMVELTENNVYKVRNFSKHQNIKKKKKDINKDKLEIVDNEKVFVDKYNNDDFIIRNEDKNNKLDLDAEAYSNNKLNSIERTVSKKNETDKFYDANSNKDFIISNEDKPNKGDMSKREIGKNKALNNDIYSIINVEKTKKNSNLNIVDFNTNNKIKNDANCVNQNNIMKDNKSTDKTKIENKNIFEKASLNKSEDINNAEVVFSDDKKTVNKDILGNEFAFEKSNNKKRKNTSKSKKKDADEIICDYASEDENIEICEFTDEVPKGNVIATFEF